MYPNWIDPVTRLRLIREHEAELRSDRMVSNRSSLKRARQDDPGRPDAGGKILARLTRLVAALAALAARRRLASDDPCR